MIVPQTLGLGPPCVPVSEHLTISMHILIAGGISHCTGTAQPYQPPNNHLQLSGSGSWFNQECGTAPAEPLSVNSSLSSDSCAERECRSAGAAPVSARLQLKLESDSESEQKFCSKAALVSCVGTASGTVPL